jgi:hypothetical protein
VSALAAAMIALLAQSQGEEQAQTSPEQEYSSLVPS